MEKNTLFQLLKEYYCVFTDDPLHNKPYAMFASREETWTIFKKNPKLMGLLTFTEWIENYSGPKQ